MSVSGTPFRDRARRLRAAGRGRSAAWLLDRTRRRGRAPSRLVTRLLRARVVSVVWTTRPSEPEPPAWTSLTVIPGSGGLLIGDQLLLQEPAAGRERSDQRSRHLLLHDEAWAVLADRPVEEHEGRYLVLDAAGAHNYYHVVFELLSKLCGVRLEPGEVLAVPATALRVPAANALLRASGPVMSLDPGRYHRMSAARSVPAPQLAPLNLRPGQTPRPTDYRYDRESLAELARALREAAGPPVPGQGQRVFLRRPAGRRAYNQDQIEEICLEHGVCPVDPGTLTPAEQVACFAEADLVVGASGAAWVNLLHSRPGTRALTWLPDSMRDFSAYRLLAEARAVEMRVLLTPDGPADGASAAVAPYRLDPLTFTAALRSSLGAH